MPEMLTRIDVLVVLVYLGAMLAVAFLVSSRSRDVEGYTVGGREMAGWVVGLSVLGTFLSSITFLGLPSKTYAANWNAYLFGAGLPVAALVAVVWFVPLYRRGDRISAYEFLEQRFGYWARLYADLSYLVLQLIRVGTVLLLVAFGVEPLFRPEGTLHVAAEAWQSRTIIAILVSLGLLVIVYDTLGGIRAVIWTDVLQVGVLMGGACWCLAILVSSWEGGAAQFFAEIPEGKTSMGAWKDGASDPSLAGWTSAVLIMLIYSVSENMRNYGTDQNYVQRMLSARSDGAARHSIWIGALTYLPLSLVFCLIGTGLAMYYQFGPGRLPEGMLPDQVFPHFIRTELPDALSGLVIAGILAAAMSTVDSSLNSASTILFEDVVRRSKMPLFGVPEIFVLRAFTVLLGVLGTGLAVALFASFGEQKAKTLMDVWWQYAGTAGGGLFGLFLLAWLLPRIPSWGAALGVLLSLPMLAWGTFFGELPEDSAWQSLACPIPVQLVGVSGTAIILAVGAILQLAVSTGVLKPNRRYQESR